MDDSTEPPQDVAPYALQQTQQENASFRSKADDIFGSLGGIELKYQADLTKRKEDDKKRSHDDEDDDDEGAREPRFKKPSLPPAHRDRDNRSNDRSRDRSPNRERDRELDWDSGHYRSRGPRRPDSRPRGRFHQPDYKVNPDKWKKYSLEDTCTYGDSFNRNVALDFISELRKRKTEGETEEGDAEASGGSCSKIEFHKPKTASTQDDEEDSGKRKNYGDVYRMSEYVIGMAKKPKSRHHVKTGEEADDSNTSGKSNLALIHLAEDDADDMDTTSSTDTDQSNSKASMPKISQPDSNESSSSQSAEGKEDSVTTSDGGTKMDSEAESNQEKPLFKFGKGKGKRKIRTRQVDDDD